MVARSLGVQTDQTITLVKVDEGLLRAIAYRTNRGVLQDWNRQLVGQLSWASGGVVIDYYRLLGVDRNAPAEDIRQAFRIVAQAYHPDHRPEGLRAAGTEVMKSLNEARETLLDPRMRAEYDEELKGSEGAGTKSSTPVPGRSEVVHGEIVRSDYLERADVVASVPVGDLCPACGAAGGPCARCRGTGLLPATRTVSLGSPWGWSDPLVLKFQAMGGEGLHGRLSRVS
jgi:DnaJ-class molecular chaperone